jgi:predicted DNA-binding helix-hairpin-helix protein
LYQADFLLRFYGFDVKDLLTPERPNFNMLLDPKCDYALRHLEKFPVEINRASYQVLLQVPGIGVTSARRIVAARRGGILDFADLSRMGVVMKRAVYFITCKDKMMYRINMNENTLMSYLVDDSSRFLLTEEGVQYEQLSLFDFGMGNIGQQVSGA